LKTYLLYAMLVSVLLPALAGNADQLETDVVYLLDVSYSMIGRCKDDGCPENREYLDQSIDILLSELDAFQRGQFALVTFAERPEHEVAQDLDGEGPILSKYELHISSVDDPAKDALRRFLRPSEYGSFSGVGSPASEIVDWPGLVEAVRTLGGEHTAIRDNLLLALSILDEYQEEHGELYLETHQRMVVLLTDGEDNDSRTTQVEMERIMEERGASVETRVLVTRYQWGTLPFAEIPGVQERPFLGKPSEFHRIYLDRSILHFTGNLWMTGEVHIEDLRLGSISSLGGDMTGDEGINWGSIQVSPGGFELPGGIALYCEPTSITPDPVFHQGYPITLVVRLTPLDLVRDHIAKSASGSGDIEGWLGFEFVPFESMGRYVDFAVYQIDAVLPYSQPELSVECEKTGQGFALHLRPNASFVEWAGAARDKVSIEFDGSHFALETIDGTSVSNELDVQLVSSPTTYVLTPHSDLLPGHYSTRIGVQAPSSENGVLVNGGAEQSWDKELVVIGLDRPSLVFPNLWSASALPGAESELAARVRNVRLFGAMPDWRWDRLRITGYFELSGVGVQPSFSPVGETAMDIRVAVAPRDLVRAMKSLINDGQPDGWLEFCYEEPNDDRLIVFERERIAVDLEYRELMVEISVSEFEGPAAGPLQPAIGLAFDFSGDVVEASRRMFVECKGDEGLAIVDESGSTIGCRSTVVAGSGLSLSVSAHAKCGVYHTTIALTPVETDIWVLNPDGSLTRQWEREFQFDIPCDVDLTVREFSFPNPWTIPETDGVRVLYSDEPFILGLGSTLPDSGELHLMLDSWPGGVAELVTDSILPPFSGDKGKLELCILDYEELLKMFPGEGPVSETVHLRHTQAGVAAGSGTEHEATEVGAFRIFLPIVRPDVDVQVARQDGNSIEPLAPIDLGIVKRGTAALELSLDLGALPPEQREVSVRFEDGEFSLGVDLLDESIQLAVLSIPMSAEPGIHSGIITIESSLNEHATINGSLVFTLEYRYEVSDPKPAIRVVETAIPLGIRDGNRLVRRGEPFLQLDFVPERPSAELPSGELQIRVMTDPGFLESALDPLQVVSVRETRIIIQILPNAQRGYHQGEICLSSVDTSFRVEPQRFGFKLRVVTGVDTLVTMLYAIWVAMAILIPVLVLLLVLYCLFKAKIPPHRFVIQILKKQERLAVKMLPVCVLLLWVTVLVLWCLLKI